MIPTCSTSCDADLPVVDFSDCNPEIVLSEITKVYIAKTTATPFTNWANAEEWTDRISQTNTVGDDYIRPLTVIGDKPAATPVVKEISNGRKKNVTSDHTINATIDDVTNVNYEFMRALECGGQFKMWYETAGGKMYGGNEGVLVNIAPSHLLNRGREETETIALSITWRAKFHPERIDSPIFGNGSSVNQFDTLLSFAASLTDTAADVQGTVPAMDPDLKLEFNAIPGAVATDITTVVKLVVGGPTVLTAVAAGEYVGRPFKFTDISGVPHYGTFAAGTVILA